MSRPAHQRDLIRLAGRVFSIFVCWLLFFSAQRMAWSQAQSDAEYRIKLAFLYNFAQFVQWPDDAFSSPTAPLTICVAGPDPFQGDILQMLSGRAAAGHPISIRKLKPDDDPRSCHMIFVRASEKTASRKLLAALKGSNALAVGESAGFADLGGIINLTLVDKKLRFEINVDAAKETQLKISSKLLALAKIVRAASKDP